MSGQERQPSTSETKAERDAKAETAHGPHLSANRRVLRDSLIVQRRVQGWPLKAIAEEAGITERQVRRVVEERRTLAVGVIEQDPVDVISDMIAAFQASIGDLELMAHRYADTHPAAAVGAKKAADQGRERLVLLLQATGRLPRDLGAMSDLMELRELASAMVDVVRAFKRGEADADRVEETFKRALDFGRAGPGMTQTAA